MEDDDKTETESVSTYCEDDGESSEDWYHESDTSENIPDPNCSEDPLYQDVNKLPVGLRKGHFEEGLLYSMTLDQGRENTMLVMIVEVKENTFIYRNFFCRGSKRKTFHEGAKDQEIKFSQVWRLAPRRELIQKRHPDDMRVGQTIRFYYGVNSSPTTALITAILSRTIKGKVECGKERGKIMDFEKFDITGSNEVFGSSILQELLKEVKDAKWIDASKIKTPERAPGKPKLHENFRVPQDEQHKRKWHMLKILGEGAGLLCNRTNARAQRNLSRSSSRRYKSQ